MVDEPDYLTDAFARDGVLKPAAPLPLAEHEKVRVTISDDADRRLARVSATAGLVVWTGDAEALERIALDAEFDRRESP